MPEVWQPIPGFDGYEASSEGRIRSPRKVLTANGKRKYKVVNIGRVPRYVHRLVALAFHGEPATDLWVLHRDDDPLNNRPSNLYWGTPKENSADKEANGNAPRGEHHQSAKLTEVQVVEIRARSEAGESRKSLAAAFGLCPQAVSHIVNRKRWAHLP